MKNIISIILILMLLGLLVRLIIVGAHTYLLILTYCFIAFICGQWVKAHPARWFD